MSIVIKFNVAAFKYAVKMQKVKCHFGEMVFGEKVALAVLPIKVNVLENVGQSHPIFFSAS